MIFEDELVREIKINGYLVQEFSIGGESMVFVNNIQRNGTYAECIQVIKEKARISRGPRCNYNDELKDQKKKEVV